ncbi:hypothetical protein ACHAXS_010793 [Conticribra weissflogii]
MAPKKLIVSPSWILLSFLHDTCAVVDQATSLRGLRKRQHEKTLYHNELPHLFSEQVEPTESAAPAFPSSVLKPDSFPVVLSAFVPTNEIEMITSRFDLLDATKSNQHASVELLDVSFLLVDANEHNNALSVLTHIYSHNPVADDLFSNVGINQQATEKLREKVRLQTVTATRTRGKPRNGSGYTTIPGFSCFRDLQGMTDAMFDLAKEFPELVTMENIGSSFLSADINAMKITAQSSNNHEKGKVLITSGVHAREYAPPELVMRYATTLAESYDIDADITWILQHTEIHLIFYVNPDGRDVAEKNPDLYWRKNVNPGSNQDGCSKNSRGVDINRNFDFMWSEKGASNNPCDETYYGTSAGSEAETQAIAAYANRLFPKEQRKRDPVEDMDVAYGEDIMGVYIDVHSSGGYTYYPWGHKNQVSPDDESLQALGRKISSFNGYKLWAPNQPDFLYPASGDTSDYMYARFGVSSFGLEIGEEFYESCKLFEEEIVPSNLPALIYAAKVAKKPFSLGKGPDVFDLRVSSDSAADAGIRVSALASDSKMVNIKNYPQFTTGKQHIKEVKVYLDVHPDNDDGSNPNVWIMNPTDRTYNNVEEDIEIMLSTSEISSGRHTVFVQAKDSKGYLGPVSSIFFDVTKPSVSQPSQAGPGTDIAENNILLLVDFANGFGAFNRGGRDAKYYQRKKGRVGVARIQDGNDDKSSIYSKKLMLNQVFSSIRVTFSFLGLGMEDDDKFCVEYMLDESLEWKKKKCWTVAVDFENKVWYDDTSVRINVADAESVRVRFRCDGDNNRDNVLLDVVQVEGEE